MCDDLYDVQVTTDIGEVFYLQVPASSPEVAESTAIVMVENGYVESLSHTVVDCFCCGKEG
jgi:hypothetical protein